MWRKPVYRMPPATSPPLPSIEPFLRQLQEADWDRLRAYMAPCADPASSESSLLQTFQDACRMLMEPGPESGGGVYTLALPLVREQLELCWGGVGALGGEQAWRRLGVLRNLLNMAARRRDRGQLVRALDLLLLQGLR